LLGGILSRVDASRHKRCRLRVVGVNLDEAGGGVGGQTRFAEAVDLVLHPVLGTVHALTAADQFVDVDQLLRSEWHIILM
jgi:hypothetical protein